MLTFSHFIVFVFLGLESYYFDKILLSDQLLKFIFGLENKRKNKTKMDKMKNFDYIAKETKVVRKISADEGEHEGWSKSLKL